MMRSIDFPCDRRWIRNPNNNPLATMGERQDAAAMTRLCIATIGIVLAEHFTAPTAFYTTADGWTRPNVWTVTLTRMSMGTLDPITGGASMKAVQDAVATWCGVKNERDPVWSWVEPIRQEKRGKGYFGVRIEIDDLAPGEPRTVVLASIERFEWLAKQRIKAAKMYKDGIKKAGRVLTYQPEAGARAASSAARGKAEQAFAKLTGKASPETLRDVERASGAIFGKPTALDLRDAAERALSKSRATVLQHPTYGPCNVDAGGIVLRAEPRARPHRDPGEERPARDLVPCEACGAPTGSPCRFFGGDKGVNGVHPQRAKAAGINGVRLPPRAPTNGSRRIVPPAQAPLPLPAAYVRLPWERVSCEPCRGTGKGRLVGPILEAREDRCAFCGCTDEEPCRRANGAVGCSWAAREDTICSRCKWTGICPRCDGRGFRGPVRRAKWPDGSTPLDGPDAPLTAPIDVPAEQRARFGDRVTLTRRRTTLPKLGDVWLYE